MHCVIMTGGKGERMRPYTYILPKGLLPIDGTPLLEILIKQCLYYGFTRITMACGYLASMIQNYFGDGSKWGIEIDYLVEEVPLGTAGALRNLSLQNESILVMNCDVLTNLNLREFFAQHLRHKSLLTVASHEIKTPIELGVLEVEEERVLHFLEKPTNRALISMGIYVVHQEALKYLPVQQRFDIPDLIFLLLANGEMVTHYQTDSFWMDIGKPNDYEKANQIYDQIKTQILPGEHRNE